MTTTTRRASWIATSLIGCRALGEHRAGKFQWQDFGLIPPISRWIVVILQARKFVRKFLQRPGGTLPVVSDSARPLCHHAVGRQGQCAFGSPSGGEASGPTSHMDGTITLSEGEEGPAIRPLHGAPHKTCPVPGRQAERRRIRKPRLSSGHSRGRVEVLASSSDPKSPAYYGPNVTALRKSPGETMPSPPRIYAEGGSFEITHLALDRDVYDYHESRIGPVLHSLRWAPRLGWAGAMSPIMLRDGEFFMLGDNTAGARIRASGTWSGRTCGIAARNSNWARSRATS